MSYPIKWNDISPEEKAARKKLYSGSDTSLEVEAVKSDPYGMYMCKSIRGIAEDIYNFELRPDDIWIVTYPKCGTTWTQEIVWQISRGVDLEAAKTTPLSERSPFIEVRGLLADPTKLIPPEALRAGVPEHIVSSVGYSRKIKSPRILKTHLPLEFLPPKLLDTCKVVYVCRNVKDVCVSFFHHCVLHKELYGYTGTFEEYANLFKKGDICYGSYWSHLKSAWKHKDHPNMKILWYEDMKKDLDATLWELCTFTGHALSEEKLEILKEHVSINNMRKVATEAAPEDDKAHREKFFRKGQVGDWKNYFDGEKIAEWDAWIKESIHGTDITMDFE